MIEINNNRTRAEELIENNRQIRARSEELIRKRAAIAGTPEVTSKMARSVSDERKEIMEMQLEAGELVEQGSGYAPSRSRDGISRSQTLAGVVTHNAKNMYKMASGAGSVSSSGSGWRGSNDTTRQIPEVYGPLWLNSNLNLPRDRATINAWSRSFFALNPIIHNAITLHSTYPIAKLNIKSKSPKVEKFFSQMIDEIDLMNVAVMAAQEYWILGEAFIYGELDENKGSWSRLMILNPDYVNVQRSVIAAEPIISLRPDENLRRVVFGNQPQDLQQRKQLDPSIIEHVRRNENIPLNNFYVHHMARKISPYEIRGTGLIVSCFRCLMLMDKLRECYSPQHEVLTKDGFKRIDEITEISKNPSKNPEYIGGIELGVNEQGNDSVAGVLQLKEGIEVACFNPETEQIEYHTPESFHISKYTGKMLHFHGKKVDALVTPNHKMWVREQSTKRNGPRFDDWKLKQASEMMEKKTRWKFRGTAKWSGKRVNSFNVCGYEVPAETYLKFLGYIVSEGCVFRNAKRNRWDAYVSLSQLTESKFCADMQLVSSQFAKCMGKKVGQKQWMAGARYSAQTPKDKWEGRMHGKDFIQYLFDNIGDGFSANSHNKRLPRFVMDLCPEQLQILLDALVVGDGSVNDSGSVGYRYSTVSKQLADDVYEIVFKCGYAPTLREKTGKKSNGRVVREYVVLWSSTEYGKEPIIYTGAKKVGNGGGAVLEEEDYDGVVWCFTVPTGLFVTRKDGKISIQGNSKFAQADGMVNPLTLVKIGDNEFRPTPTDLEHWRNVFEECHDEETEVLTDQGFKKFDEVIECSEILESGNKHISSPKAGVKIACFDPEKQSIEYCSPSESHVYDYNDEMYHFNNDQIDIKVTPEHNMWVFPLSTAMDRGVFRTMDRRYWEKVKAKKLFNQVKDLYEESEYLIIVDESLAMRALPKPTKEHYSGKVWCFTVPTGLFVTRRNGKITIQGNCQYDKDFKIFSHNAVDVQRIGYGQGIYDTSADITQLIKEIYIGLMVPSVIMDGSDTTYATGSVALDVLRQRYVQFRQMMSGWLRRKIFAPISQINDFYEYIDGEKTLIVPEVDWNHMSLFDMDSYINNLVNLSQGEGAQKRVALQTLYHSLGLEYEEEQRKMRYEDIQDTIRMKEIAAMQKYSIYELKALGPGDEIDGVADEPVPGESPYEAPEGVGPGPGAPPGPPMPGAPPSAPIGGGGMKPPAGGGLPPI